MPSTWWPHHSTDTPDLEGLPAVEAQEIRREYEHRDLAPAVGAGLLQSELAALVEPGWRDHRQDDTAGIQGVRPRPAPEQRGSSRSLLDGWRLIHLVASGPLTRPEAARWVIIELVLISRLLTKWTASRFSGSTRREVP
jgi:hypothetical protein